MTIPQESARISRSPIRSTRNKNDGIRYAEKEEGTLSTTKTQLSCPQCGAPRGVEHLATCFLMFQVEISEARPLIHTIIDIEFASYIEEIFRSWEREIRTEMDLAKVERMRRTCRDEVLSAVDAKLLEREARLAVAPALATAAIAS